MSGNGNGRKPRLELTWIGKDERPRLEPRILLPVDEMSHAKGELGDGGIRDNILIQGDNLLALKALEQQFAGKVKCVFIDPPYNTGSAFGSLYDDGVEHSRWLTLIRDRLELLFRLMSSDGSIWITIDDNEQPYLRMLMDEVFGRQNFVAQVVWQKVYSVKSSAKHLSAMHDYVLVYAKNIDELAVNLLPRSEKSLKLFKNPDKDPRGDWRSGPIAARNYYSLGTYAITCPSGRIIPGPPKGSYWRFSKEKLDALDRDGRIWWGEDGNNVPAPKLYLSEVGNGVRATTLWLHTEVGNNQDAKKHLLEVLPQADEVFITPKPEGLIERILQLSTDPGDFVLDSFAGSGTTGAVAHKMGRRWIMVELGDHATTHIVPRLKKVIDGQDAGGVTEATGWKGGGGFRFYKLAPSLIAEDQFGQKIISKAYNPEMLVEAMCKHMGYTYAPAQDRQLFWQQGFSTERDFIYVTTQSLTHDALKALSLEVGAERTLLVCCKAFRAGLSDFPNLTVKKIPQAVLDNCEWGRDDYSLSIAKPPEDSPADPDDSPDEDNGNGGEATPRRRGRPRRTADPESAADARAVVAAPVKKAPLKMDGTTRQPRVPKITPVSVAAPSAVTISAKPSKAVVKPKAAAPKTAPKSKPGKAEKPKAAKNGAKKPKARSAAGAKPRRKADDRQGSLL